MNPQIKSEIEKFEALQNEFEDHGAADSEPDYIFQLVIANAITKDPVDFGQPIEWSLFDEENNSVIAQKLTTQAWIVYESIQKLAQAEDFELLRKYCWRLDDAEFSSWEDLSKNRPLGSN